MINGDRVIVGDTVYDVQRGACTVINIEPDNSFTVLYPEQDTQRFSSGGYFGQRRRIYWTNPYIIDPKKGAVIFWPKFVEMVTGIYNMFLGAFSK